MDDDKERVMINANSYRRECSLFFLYGSSAPTGHRMSVHFGCPASGIMDEDVMCTLQGLWLLQGKINAQLNHHLLTAAVQCLRDSKNEAVIRGRLIFRASGPRARLEAGTPPGLSPDILQSPVFLSKN